MLSLRWDRKEWNRVLDHWCDDTGIKSDENHDRRRDRLIGDKHTWRLSLNTSGVIRPESPYWAMESCAFGLAITNTTSAPLTTGTKESNRDSNKLDKSSLENFKGHWHGLAHHVDIRAHVFTHPSLKIRNSGPAGFVFQFILDETFIEELDIHSHRQLFKLGKKIRTVVSKRFSWNAMAHWQHLPGDWV